MGGMGIELEGKGEQSGELDLRVEPTAFQLQKAEHATPF